MVTLRSEKGSALTHIEMDANFEGLDARATDLETRADDLETLTGEMAASVDDLEDQTTPLLAEQIKTDTTTPTDLTIVTGADKTLVLDTPVWDDIPITPGNFDRPGQSDPTYVTFGPSSGSLTTFLLEFAVGNIASFTKQLPHAYTPGQDIYVHIHWTPGPNGVAEDGALVGWKIDYTWANIGDVFPEMQTLDLSDVCDGVDDKHQMTADVLIPGDSKGISSMLLCNIKRTSTGSDDTWAGSTSGNLPLMLEIDFHVPLDTMGSREKAAK